MHTSEDDTLSIEELVELNKKRSATYALLARLYRSEVDEAFLAELRGARYPAASGNESADEGYLRIARYLSTVREDSVAELARDFARCFIGKGQDSSSAAYPFESVYSSQKRLLMQDARDEVLALIRSEGFDKSSSFKETEDHIGLELEFMQRLAERTNEALRTGDEGRAAVLYGIQRSFLADHLLSWVFLFTGDLRRFARTGLYQGLAYLTDGFLQVEDEFLAAIACNSSQG